MCIKFKKNRKKNRDIILSTYNGIDKKLREFSYADNHS